MARIRLLALVLLAAALTGCLGDDEPEGRGERTAPATAPAPPPAGAYVRVDLGAEPRRGPSMSGFLHSLEHGASPRRVDQAAPAQVLAKRAVTARRTSGRGAWARDYQVVLSDLWGYPSDRLARSRPAVGDLDAWARTVAPGGTLAARAGRWSATCGTSPTPRPSGTARASSSSRSTRWRRERSWTSWAPEPWWAGPSTTKRAIRRGSSGLLRYCRERALPRRLPLLPRQPPALGADPGDRPAPPRAAEARGPLPRPGAAPHRGERVGGPRGPVQPRLDHRLSRPLEAGGADAAARSCWPGLQGEDNCTNGTLEGLLTPSGQPRSAWWAYRALRRGSGVARARSVSDSWTVLAGWRACDRAPPRCVLGRLDRAAPGTPPVDVELRLPGLRRALPGARSVLVTVERLPNSGDQPLPAPRRCRAGE